MWESGAYVLAEPMDMSRKDDIEIHVCLPIEAFTVNGEMAPVTWYRQGKYEYNGKYIMTVEYYDQPNE